MLDDRLARPMLGFHTDRDLMAAYRDGPASHIPGVDTLFALRGRYGEDALAEAVSSGTDQYVVLGAGLDSFAHRRPASGDLNVFEVDSALMQDWKRQRLDALGYARRSALTYVPVDFEEDDLRNRLAQAGLDRSRSVFITIMGLSQYLRKSTFETMLATCATLSSASCTMVMEFVLPAASTGEPSGRRSNSS